MDLVESVEAVGPETASNSSNVSTRVMYTVASFLVCATLYIVSSKLSSLILAYKNLPLKQQVFWNLAVVRGSFGVFGIFLGSWSLFFDKELKKDIIYATTPLSNFITTVALGFFIFECAAVIISDIVFRQFNTLLNIHHYLSLMGFGCSVTFGCIHFFATRGLILEMSTPFSCLCWTLLKANMADTITWKANQFILVHSFHLRSVVECYLWYESYVHWDYIWTEMPWIMFLCLYSLLFLATFVMTPYWTYKKTAQMFNPIDWNFVDAKLNQEMYVNGEKYGKED